MSGKTADFSIKPIFVRLLWRHWNESIISPPIFPHSQHPGRHRPGTVLTRSRFSSSRRSCCRPNAGCVPGAVHSDLNWAKLCNKHTQTHQRGGVSGEIRRRHMRFPGTRLSPLKVCFSCPPAFPLRAASRRGSFATDIAPPRAGKRRGCVCAELGVAAEATGGGARRQPRKHEQVTVGSQDRSGGFTLRDVLSQTLLVGGNRKWL